MNSNVEKLDLLKQKDAVIAKPDATASKKQKIIDLLTGLYRPDSGRIVVDHREGKQ